MVLKFEDFINESKKSIVLPDSMTNKILLWKEKGWWMGKIDETCLSKITDFKTLAKEFERCKNYASSFDSWIDFDSRGNDWIIEFEEEVERDSNKFEKSSGKVPYQVKIGDNVLFTYGTVGSSNSPRFTLSEFKEFIDLNK